MGSLDATADPVSWIQLRSTTSNTAQASSQASFAVRSVITAFSAIAMYNGLEIFVLVFMTFKCYRGTYFWSLLAAAFGLIVHPIGNILKDLGMVHDEGSIQISVTLSIVGWWFMVTGQLFVLWSRLGLLVAGRWGESLKGYTLIMIIVGSICLYVPTSVLAWGANSGVPGSAAGYKIVEKIQIAGFYLQELILSSIYVVLAARFLQTSLNPNSRSIMHQLFAINIVIILLDTVVLVLESINLFVLQVALKPGIYSIKLKLEFAILSRLLEVVGGPVVSSEGRSSRRSSTFALANGSEKDKSRRTSRSDTKRYFGGFAEDISDFVDVEKISGDFTRAVPPAGQRKLVRLHDNLSDTDLVAPRLGVTFIEIEEGSSQDKIVSEQETKPEDIPPPEQQHRDRNLPEACQ